MQYQWYSGVVASALVPTNSSLKLFLCIFDLHIRFTQIHVIQIYSDLFISLILRTQINLDDLHLENICCSFFIYLKNPKTYNQLYPKFVSIF